jgi:hypothetical protein
VSDLAEARASESEHPRYRICPVRVASFSPWAMLTIGDYCLPAILDSCSSFFVCYTRRIPTDFEPRFAV